MKDGTRELTNNQWLLKADADKLPATYAELVTLLTGAGLPFGRTLLSDGWTIEPDPLNKASLLKDATAAKYELPSTAMVNDVLSLLGSARHYGKYSQMGSGLSSTSSGVIQFSAELNDDYSAINIPTSNSKIVVPSGVSLVRVFATVSVSVGNTTAPNSVSVFKNGSNVGLLGRNGGVYNSGFGGSYMSAPITVVGGDYLQLYFLSDTGMLSEGSTFGMEVLG